MPFLAAPLTVLQKTILCEVALSKLMSGSHNERSVLISRILARTFVVDTGKKKCSKQFRFCVVIGVNYDTCGLSH